MLQISTVVGIATTVLLLSNCNEPATECSDSDRRYTADKTCLADSLKYQLVDAVEIVVVCSSKGTPPSGKSSRGPDVALMPGAARAAFIGGGSSALFESE